MTFEREFDFTRSDFDEVRRLIHAHAGISLSDAKEDMVYSRLTRRLRATGIGSFREYLQVLREGGNKEWQNFVNALTTNLTDFFREAHHFTALAEFLRAHRGQQLELWSAAASTGEEPYSMAITVLETLGAYAPVRILASDLDTNVLRKAEEGIYPIDRLSKLSPDQQSRFFLKGAGERAGQAHVKPELTALVKFFPLNLLAPNWPIDRQVDIIFCRNVMIYFDKPTQYGILARLKRLLKPHGLLFVGHSEALYHASDLFHLRGQTIYEHAEPNGKHP